jgi:hypothetical protein
MRLRNIRILFAHHSTPGQKGTVGNLRQPPLSPLKTPQNHYRNVV